MTTSAALAQLEQDGFHFYRQEFRWGRSDAYRTDDKAHFRFLVGGQVLTPRQLLAHLRESWRPMRYEDQVYFATRMAYELEHLPE